MTNERAIELLHRISDSQFDGIHGDERREALEMAVRALSGDGDTISRKMAIEAFEPTHYKDWYTPTIIETLETLPSVRPEVLACGNGELVKESDGLVKDLVKDCISRKAVMKILSSKNAAWDAYDKVKQLPSVQPVNYGATKSDSSSQLKLNNDLISRKQVLNASHFVACWDGVEHFSLEVVDADFIQKLPSVQPTQSNAQSTQFNALDCVSRQVAIDALTELRKKTVASDSFRLGIYYSIEEIKNVPSAQLDSQEIGYWECSNALLKMWIDNVLTDGEYYRIADKLNTYWKEKIRGKNGE